MEDWSLPTIDMVLCNGCGLCITYCPANAVELINSRPVITRPLDCAYCGLCEESCPQNAIALQYEIVFGSADQT